MQIKSLIRIVLITAGILLVPLVAMQFNDQVDWSASDFAVAGVLLITVGVSYELLTRNLHNVWHRVAVGGVLFILLLLVWVQLAVGIV